MLPAGHAFELSFRALRRNRLQTALAMLGVTVGVGALVTSIALGNGAQDSINDQLRAAGANMIVITAGNYQVQKPEGTEGEAGHMANRRRVDPDLIRSGLRQVGLARVGHGPSQVGDGSAQVGHGSAQVGHGRAGRQRLLHNAMWYPAAGPAMWSDEHGWRQPAGSGFRRVHYEDDPNAVHDHPTAKERLGDSMAGLGAAATLTRDDSEAIRTQIPGIQFVTSGVHENARVSLPPTGAANAGGPRQWFTRLHGTEAELPDIRRGWTLTHGKFLSRKHVEQAARVMVLGRWVADRLFGAEVDPTGRTVMLWNQEFEVLGVVGSRSWAVQPTAGDDQFDAVYVPVSTVHALLNLSKLNTITVTTESAGDTTRISGEIVKLLRERHGITDTMPDDFTVKTQAQQLLGKGLPPDLARVVAGNMRSVDTLTIEQLSDSLSRANWTMLGLLAGVATVSLLVGGIGVMNVLLLSVTQRTGEVGLRIALGARRSDVATQFVLEAVLLSLVGGLLGALLGVFASTGLEKVFQWSASVSPSLIVLAIAVAGVLGAVSGAYPANRAARLDPIQALHHE
jgi:putative ABC transport system permease protein